MHKTTLFSLSILCPLTASSTWCMKNNTPSDLPARQTRSMTKKRKENPLPEEGKSTQKKQKKTVLEPTTPINSAEQAQTGTMIIHTFDLTEATAEKSEAVRAQVAQKIMADFFGPEKWQELRNRNADSAAKSSPEKQISLDNYFNECPVQ